MVQTSVSQRPTLLILAVMIFIGGSARVPPQPQYVFIYEAILEAIMCGDTSIAAPELKKVILSLQEVDTTTGKTGIQQQFEVWMTTSES